ncbi:MAG: rane protein of unknown function [Candidatus Saccharibacteria bacterium]|nr:rane protein of unknown function [Candidatus Saccharibacteria bacterium]
MKISRIINSFAVVVIAAATIVLPVSATEYGGGSVQGYASEAVLDNGTIVQLDGKGTKAVKVATQSELQNMFGVTVDRSQLSVTLSDAGLKNETFVAVSGTYNVLVSTQGGSIATGDYVTLSSVNGIAMKAGTEEKTVFGRAVGGFDGKGVTLGTTTLKETNGKPNKTVTLGAIPVTIDIKRNPNEKSTKSDLPEILQRIGQAIAEKEVSPIRIYLSMGITAVSLIAAIAVLYSGVRSGVISIGRNPMSKKSIFRALLEIILTSILILIIGLFAVYLLLKL